MLEKRGNWRNRIALSLLILISITVLTIHFKESETGFLHNFQRWSMDLLVPLQTGVFRVVRSIGGTWRTLSQLRKSQEENKALKKEVSELRRQLVLLNELQRENKRLRRELNSPIKKKYKTIFATVIGKSVNSWQASVVLDRGSEDGVKKHMPVATADGLVGQVILVTRHASLVQLIVDRKSAVGARLQTNRASGIVEGQGGRELRLNYISRETKVRRGEIVITSGLGGIYPPGIVIGTISRVGRGTYGLFKDIKVSPAVNFSALEEVFIITNAPPPVPFGSQSGKGG